MTIQKQILALLRSLQEACDFACLFISHELGAAGQVADRVFVMDDERVVEAAERDTVFEQPQHDYTPRLRAASPALSVTSEGFELQSRNRVAI
jgi:peptide/nickel transport system ATP-binding protein